MSHFRGRTGFNLDGNELLNGSCFISLFIFIIKENNKRFELHEEQKSKKDPGYYISLIEIIFNIQNCLACNKMQEGEIKSEESYILSRILYSSVLIIFLLLISFYFDLLSDYDALSLVLGFVVSIVLQFFFLSYYLGAEMRRYKMDQIGVLKWKIKLLFGELHPQHIERKNRIKYYHHQGNHKDRIFHKDNQQIYRSMMSSLRRREDPNFNESIAKIKLKWTFIEEKVALLQKFFAAMQQQYQKRKAIYSRYKPGLLRLKERRQYRQWQQFLKEQSSKLRQYHNTTFYSQYEIEPALEAGDREFIRGIRLDWETFSWLVLQKSKINDRQASCLKDNIAREFGAYVKSIREAREAHSRNRERLLADYKAAREEKNQILKEIQRVSVIYSQLKAALQSNRIRQKQDVEAVLKKQFGLRLQRIQLQNLQVKISRAQSRIAQTAELLQDQGEVEEGELQDHLHKLNSKFTNYLNMMAGLGETKAPQIKKYLEEQALSPISELSVSPRDPQAIAVKLTSRRKAEGSFRLYLVDALSLFKQLASSHRQAQGVIQDFKPKMERTSSEHPGRTQKELSGARLHYFASNVKDIKLLKMFERINAIELKLAEIIVGEVGRQASVLASFQQQIGFPLNRQLKRTGDEVRRKEQEVKRIRKRGQQAINESEELREVRQRYVQQAFAYLQNQKIPSPLVSILAAGVQNELSYSRYANEVVQQEQFQRGNEKIDNQDTQARQRYAAYHAVVDRADLPDYDEETLFKSDYLAYFLRDRSLDPKTRNEAEVWNFANYSLKQSLGKAKNKEALRVAQLNTFRESSDRTHQMINRLIGVLFNEWSRSQQFHEFVKEELLVSLNRKKPDIVEHLNIEHFRIIEKDKNIPPFKFIKVHPTQAYRCAFDVIIDFSGKIAVQIGSRLKVGNKPRLEVQLLIKQFECPIRICFTPYSIGKSFASLLERPKLTIDLSVRLGGFNLTSIPFFSMIIKTYIILKLRKKMLWPKRMTLSVPLAYKSTLDLAIAQRNRYQKDKQKLQKKTK